MKCVLVTGSAGLIGSEAARHYNSRVDRVIGIDNNMRANFFGPDGDTNWQRKQLEADCKNYRHSSIDIRDRSGIDRLIGETHPDAIIHCAAQPSHDLAATIPFDDFEVNALGTLNLLEATRKYIPEAPFIFTSTNKVYGDAPNNIKMIELATRYDFDDPNYERGIPEMFSIDQSKHSLFGASKAAADLMVQEYGRYFGMNTVCFRGGCLTGTGHSGAELHGYLAYLFKATAAERHYTIFGYKGKQVRDQIHSRDVIAAFDAFIARPRQGVVYNLGGGKRNSVSILESIDRIHQLSGRNLSVNVSAENRIGDHICYYTDTSRFETDYPEWRLAVSIDQIFEEFAAIAFSGDKNPAFCGRKRPNAAIA
jgi:CDP-paratose 2-epimerase